MTTRQKLYLLPILTVGILCVSSTARAGLNTTSPEIPPSGGIFVAQSQPGYAGPGLAITVLNFEFTIGSSVNRTASGPDELQEFNATANSAITFNGSPPILSSSSGQATTISQLKIGNVTGTFQTEMLQMSLSGNTPLGPYMLRESPTLASLGVTSVSNIGGGLFQIDSFFDVFTELSIDGGATWLPDTNGPSRLVLNAVPEPNSMALLASALVSSMSWRVSRRHRTTRGTEKGSGLF